MTPTTLPDSNVNSEGAAILVEININEVCLEMRKSSGNLLHFS